VALDRDYVTLAEIDMLVGVAELRIFLGLGREGGQPVSRSYAEQVVNGARFPAPLIRYPRKGRLHVRLWLLGPVLAWMDVNKPSWRGRLPAGSEHWTRERLMEFVDAQVFALDT